MRAASGELLKDGARVRLQDQPFRLLVVLLEHAGQVVTREEIQRRIWPENTFVDFDSSVRVALRKLRDALGDDADKPVYVETIPKRGYRFLLPVTVTGPDAGVAVMDAPPLAVPPHRRRRALWLSVAITAVVALVVSYVAFARRSASTLGDTDTVVLAEFTNTTNDPVFDLTLRQGLIVQLEQSPFLSLVSDDRIQQTLRLMTLPADTRVAPDIALAVCERTGSAAVLGGSVARLGAAYVIALQAKNCRTGALLDQEQGQASRKEDVLATLGRMAGAFRRRLGESLATIDKYDTPLADATTASLEAFRAYAAGMRALSSTGSASAIPLFREAAELDPRFAMAHAWLGRVYGDTGEFSRSAESTAKAYELRGRVSQAEQYFIAASYDLQVSGNLEKARQTCESWVEVYPRAFAPHSFLAGIIFPALGAFDRARTEARRTIDVDPGFWLGYYLLAYANQYQNRFAEAGNALDEAGRRGLEVPEFVVERYDLSFLQHDSAGMDRAVSRAGGMPEAEYLLDDHRAFVLAYEGRLPEANALAERAAAVAQQSGEPERAAQFQAGEALWNAFAGDAAAADRAAAAALARSTARDVEFGAAVAFALSRSDARAASLAADLDRRFPEDTDARFRYVPTIRALLAVNGGRPADALALLQLAAPYELAPPRSSMHAFFGALYPVYVRGLAYLALHRAADAAAEFQKIVDRPGIVVSDPVGTRARTLLARSGKEVGR